MLPSLNIPIQTLCLQAPQRLVAAGGPPHMNPVVTAAAAAGAPTGGGEVSPLAWGPKANKAAPPTVQVHVCSVVWKSVAARPQHASALSSGLQAILQVPVSYASSGSLFFSLREAASSDSDCSMSLPPRLSFYEKREVSTDVSFFWVRTEASWN